MTWAGRLARLVRRLDRLARQWPRDDGYRHAGGRQGGAVTTFEEVSTANRARAGRWHPGFPLDDTWTIADWCLAMCGEAGEAANVVKKMLRQSQGLKGKLDPPVGELFKMLAEELADVYLYMDLLAAKAGIDLPAAIVAKFNKVSELQDFPERLRSTGGGDRVSNAHGDPAMRGLPFGVWVRRGFGLEPPKYSLTNR